jgi:pilus assembly protein CpaF
VSLSGIQDAIEAQVSVPGGTGLDRPALTELVRSHAPLLPSNAVRQVVDRVMHRVHGLGPLEPLLSDPAVTDVLVNGPGHVWVERGGCLERTAIVLTTPDIEQLIERVVSPLGLRADRTSPLVDARLPDGSRVNAVVPPLAVDGPCLAIRRFGVSEWPLERLASPGIAALLSWAVAARCNTIVSGGTGAGKTTLLNAVAAKLPAGERLITVEDIAELRLPHPHVVRLEARPSNADGLGEVPIRELVRNALRMRPDRIVVGEVRGPEALDMLQAMNTGHEGSLSTCHANSPSDATQRLEMMVLLGGEVPLSALREQMVSSLDLIVQVVRLPGGVRRAWAVAEVVPELDERGCVAVHPLTTSGRLVELPRRIPRALGTPPPDPEWIALDEPLPEDDPW